MKSKVDRPAHGLSYPADDLALENSGPLIGVQGAPRTVANGLWQTAMAVKIAFIGIAAVQLAIITAMAVNGFGIGAWLLSVAVAGAIAAVAIKRHHALFGANVDLQKQLDVASTRLADAERQAIALGIELARLAKQSRQDDATGALNRDAFIEVLDREIEASRRTEVPLCVLALQPDATADEVSTFQCLAVALKQRVRASDRVAIASPNQIVVLLHNTTVEDATQVCEGWVTWLSATVGIAVSAGLSDLFIHRDRASTLVGRSTQALEHAKAKVGGGSRLSVIEVNPSRPKLTPVP